MNDFNLTLKENGLIKFSTDSNFVWDWDNNVGKYRFVKLSFINLHHFNF